jgi:subtilisin family serine protease
MNKRSIYSISFLLVVVFTSFLFLTAIGGSPSPRDLIHLRTGTIDTSQKAPDISGGLKLMGLSLGDQAYYIVQFKGPIEGQWKAKVKDVGGAFFDYLPNNAFIVKMDGDILDTIKGFPEIKWIGLYQPDYKVDPQLTAKAQGMEEAITLTVKTFEAQQIDGVQNTLLGLRAEILASSGNKWGGTIRVRIAASLIPRIINLPWVKWVEEYIPPKLFNDRAVTPGEMNVTGVWTNALTGTGQIVAVADTGLDIGVNDATLHLDFQGAVSATYGLGVGRGGDWSDQHGHGTHVSGSVLGRGTVSGGTYRGVAYDAQLVFQSIMGSDGQLSGIPIPLSNLFLTPYNDGARIHSNSWGESFANGAYTADSQAADQFMWDHKDMLVVFAAGNSGVDMDSDGVVDTDSMAAPATAKNVLTVGANENDRNVAPFTSDIWSNWGYAADPIAPDPTANNPSGMAAFSSRGPCDDGRIKPDVVAPGTYVASARSHKHAFNDMMATNDTSQWTSDAEWSYVAHVPSGFEWSTGGVDPVTEASLTMANPIDLRMGGDTLFFSASYNLGDDEAYIDIRDAVIDWTPLYQLIGPTSWADLQLPFGFVFLSGFDPQSIQFRFRLVSGGTVNHGTGWQIHRMRIYSTGWARMPEMGIGANWDTTDENYHFMGGTSMATPLTAGAAALVRQYYVDNEGISPSAALIKATLIGGATDISPGQYGTGATQEIPDPPRPNNVEGWGRVNLENAIFPTGRVLEYLDDTSGISYLWRRTITFQNNSAADLTVTLVWTDYPSTPASSVNLVNDLDLSLTDPSSAVHYPNGLSGCDRTNNVEVIDLSSPSVGEYTIAIYGQSVPHGPQAFALVVCGDIDTFTDLGNHLYAEPVNFRKTDGSACFIATAAYGSPSGRFIDFLRAFRDQYLLATPIGQKWIDLYYRYSPVVAEFVADRPAMRKGVRLTLFPFIAFSAGMVHTTALQKGLILCFVGGFLAGMVLLSKRRILN